MAQQEDRQHTLVLVVPKDAAAPDTPNFAQAPMNPTTPVDGSALQHRVDDVRLVEIFHPRLPLLHLEAVSLEGKPNLKAGRVCASRPLVRLREVDDDCVVFAYTDVVPVHVAVHNALLPTLARRADEAPPQGRWRPDLPAEEQLRLLDSLARNACVPVISRQGCDDRVAALVR